MKFIIGAIVVALALVIVACNQSTTATTTDGVHSRGHVTLECLDITGTNIVTYEGTNNSNSISWYGDGTYVQVNTGTVVKKIPQHRCEYTEYK